VLIFSFASTLIAFLFYCLHFILKILKGMDQTRGYFHMGFTGCVRVIGWLLIELWTLLCRFG
jgi:hypothetical protein